MRSLVFFAFFCSAMFWVEAAPSGVLSFGDSGGDNADNSVNYYFVTKEGPFTPGGNNAIVISDEVEGTNVIGTSSRVNK
ncbi:uncharacterized protein EV154DRAFT_495784 [Mucor mucedo]|uniref:uncharacterized protein n=1 Tax=Mucor mucedo TaxID=29922 RepID=UPI002220265A|nr:uncharacterized protein EV154DRAFT_495784 [Mucor mucedo]KAI7895381.1 hypothetical protein EV154DRAFT_495784 [Mucor mucedo]